MQSAEISLATTGSLLRRLLDWLSPDGIAILFDVSRVLRHLLPHQPQGMYEILDYDASLELLDTKGERAIFHKRQKVIFRQDNVIAFEDYAWGDGEVLVDYRCTPGVVVDKYREGDRWNILIALHGTKSVGDVEHFYIERTVINGYLREEEWLQTEIRRQTRRLKMSVIFPQQRCCSRAEVSQRRANRVTALGPDHFHRLPDGRQLVTWETNHVRGYEVYTLKWRW
jgi:hypothetical protein